MAALLIRLTGLPVTCIFLQDFCSENKFQYARVSSSDQPPRVHSLYTPCWKYAKSFKVLCQSATELPTFEMFNMRTSKSTSTPQWFTFLPTNVINVFQQATQLCNFTKLTLLKTTKIKLKSEYKISPKHCVSLITEDL